MNDRIDGFVQDCSNSIANALELLQSRTKPFRYILSLHHWPAHGFVYVYVSQDHSIDGKVVQLRFSQSLFAKVDVIFIMFVFIFFILMA